MEWILEKEQNWGFTFMICCLILSILLRCFGGPKMTIPFYFRYYVKESQMMPKPYNYFRPRYESEYDRSNPITAEEKTEEFIKWMKSKFLIKNSKRTSCKN